MGDSALAEEELVLRDGPGVQFLGEMTGAMILSGIMGKKTPSLYRIKEKEAFRAFENFPNWMTAEGSFIA